MERMRIESKGSRDFKSKLNVMVNKGWKPRVGSPLLTYKALPATIAGWFRASVHIVPIDRTFEGTERSKKAAEHAAAENAIKFVQSIVNEGGIVEEYEKDSIVTIVEGMCNYPTEVALQEEGCRALVNFAKNDGTRVAIVEQVYAMHVSCY